MNDTSNRFGTRTLGVTRQENDTGDVQFQYGHHFYKMAAMVYPEITFFQMAADDRKNHFDNKLCILSIYDAVDGMRIIGMIGLSQYGRTFPRWPPSAIK